MKTRKLSNGKTDCKNMIFFSSMQINLMSRLLTFVPCEVLGFRDNEAGGVLVEADGKPEVMDNNLLSHNISTNS
jgi:hypothetical protein